MRSKTNWPYGTNYGHQNWNGRYGSRMSGTDSYGAYQPGSERIPLSGYIGAAAVLGLVFGYVPFLQWLMG